MLRHMSSGVQSKSHSERFLGVKAAIKTKYKLGSLQILLKVLMKTDVAVDTRKQLSGNSL